MGCMQCVQVVTWCHGVQVYTLGQFIHMVVKVNIYSNKTRRRREVTSLRENRKAILTFFIISDNSYKVPFDPCVQNTHTLSVVVVKQIPVTVSTSDLLKYQQVTCYSINK